MPTNLTLVPSLESGSRPETGPMQFGEDWPGVFIRGDHALFYSFSLAQFLKKFKDDEEFFKENWHNLSVLEGLYKTLASCRV